MECHACKYHADILSGKYRRTPFNRTPCAKCELFESSIGTLPVNPERPVVIPGYIPGTEPTGEMVPFPDDPDAEVATVEEDVSRVAVRRVCRFLLSVPEDVRETVCLRLLGHSLGRISSRQGIRKGTAWQRLRRAGTAMPELRPMLAGRR